MDDKTLLKYFRYVETNGQPNKFYFLRNGKVAEIDCVEYIQETGKLVPDEFYLKRTSCSIYGSTGFFFTGASGIDKKEIVRKMREAYERWQNR